MTAGRPSQGKPPPCGKVPACREAWGGASDRVGDGVSKGVRDGDGDGATYGATYAVGLCPISRRPAWVPDHPAPWARDTLPRSRVS